MARPSRAFRRAVLIALALVALDGAMILLMQVRPGFLGMTHFRQPGHRMHDLTFGFLFAPAVAGMLAQLRAPSRNVAGQLMALIPWAALVLSVVFSFVLTNSASSVRVLNPAWVGPATATLISALLHPARRTFLRSLSFQRINWVMLALVVVAAVPLLALAVSNFRLQGTIVDDHAGMGHYGFMAAFGLTVIGVGLLASMRPDGWSLTAWIAGSLPAALGLASVLYPSISSSLSAAWTLAAMAWGVAFVAAAELTREQQTASPP